MQTRKMGTISFDDFQKLDIRIGTVVKAEVPEWSHWVIKLTVNFGPSFAKATDGKSTRICFSGIMKFFKPESLLTYSLNAIRYCIILPYEREEKERERTA